jgi:hypothetical protein
MTPINKFRKKKEPMSINTTKKYPLYGLFPFTGPFSSSVPSIA